MFDACYVLNLDSRPDRLEAFWDRLPVPWPLPEVKRWPASDGRTLKVPEGWQATPGAWGCLLSHLAILEEALGTGRNILVLEDDVIFRHDFSETWRAFATIVPEPWDMLYLGGQHHPYSLPIPVAPGVVRCMGTTMSHAYGVHCRALFTLIQAIRAAINHIDTVYWSMHRHLHVYAPERWLCGQAAGESDVLGFNARGYQLERWFDWKPVEAVTP